MRWWLLALTLWLLTVSIPSFQASCRRSLIFEMIHCKFSLSVNWFIATALSLCRFFQISSLNLNIYHLLRCKCEQGPCIEGEVGNKLVYAKVEEGRICFPVAAGSGVRLSLCHLWGCSWLPHVTSRPLTPIPASLRTPRPLFGDTHLWWPVNTLAPSPPLPPAWCCLTGPFICTLWMSNTHPTLECILFADGPVWI